MARATPNDLYMALARTVRQLMSRWLDTVSTQMRDLSGVSVVRHGV